MPVSDDKVRAMRRDGRGGISESSERSYKHYWKAFEAWAKVNDEPSLPARGEAVAVFLWEKSHTVSEETGQPYSLSALKLMRSAINWKHSEARLSSPCNHKDVRDIMFAAAEDRPDNPRQSLPLDDEVLAEIRQTACIPRQHPTRIESYATAQARGRKEIALCAFLSHAGCRIGEAAALRWGQIVKTDDSRGIVTFLRTKNRRVRTVAIPSHVMADLERIRNGASDMEPVFPSRKGREASTKILQRWMRLAVEATGRDKERFTGHSGRIASAQRHARAGISPTLSQVHHGWESADMPAYYSRHIEALRVLDALGES